MKLKLPPPFLYSLISFSFLTALDGDIYDFFLPNGLKVILMEKHASPKVAVSVFYNVGSHDEVEGQKGINNIVKGLILEGTEKYSDDELNNMRDEFSMGYGDRSGRDITYLYSELPRDELEFGLDFESDRMINVTVTDKKILEVKENFKIRYDKYHKNGIWVTFNNAMGDILHEGHPYKSDDWGIWEQIDSLSVKTCNNFLKQYYAPNNAVLVVVGDIIPGDATKLIYQYFSSIKPAEYIPPDPDFSFDKKINYETPEYFAENEWDPMYEHITSIAFFMPTARSDDTILLGHLENILILDSNKYGQLRQKYSKKDRLFFKPYIHDESALGPSSFLFAGLNIFRKGSVKKIKKALLSTLDFIGKNGVGNDLLTQYKKTELLKSYKKDYNYSSISNRLGKAELINGDYHFYNRRIQLLKELTNEDIKKVVNTYLHENNMYSFTITVNTAKKTWYNPFLSFLTNQIVLRFWSPTR